MRIATRTEVLEELEFASRSEPLAQSPSLQELLRYLVRTTLDHPERNPPLKGAVIASEFFGYTPGEFDSRQHSTVKTAAHDLRGKLAQYYAAEGSRRVRIEIPKGRYVPIFHLQTEETLEQDSQALARISWFRHHMAVRCGVGSMASWHFLSPVEQRYPGHPLLLALRAMDSAVTATCTVEADARARLLEAEELVSEVRALDAEPWECVLTEAWIQATLHWQWEKAEALFDRAIVLGGHEAVICNGWYPAFLAARQRLEEAVTVMRNAMMDARDEDVIANADLAFFQVLAGDVDGAEQTLKFMRPSIGPLEEESFVPIGYTQLAMVHAARGDFERACQTLLQRPMHWIDQRLALSLIGVFAASFDPETSRTAYDTYLDEPQTFSALPIAFAALGCGEHEDAVRWLNIAAERREPLVILAGALPCLRLLQRHEGFKELLRKMNLPLPLH